MWKHSGAFAKKNKYFYLLCQFCSCIYTHKTTYNAQVQLHCILGLCGKVWLKFVNLLLLRCFTVRPSLIVVWILSVTCKNMIGGKTFSRARARARTHTHTHTHCRKKWNILYVQQKFFDSDLLWNNDINLSNSPEMSDCVYNFADNWNYITNAGKELTPYTCTSIDLKTLNKSRTYGSYSTNYPTWN